MPITFRKRQKEMKRREKQRIKEERREQRKLANRAAREGGEQTPGDPMMEENGLEGSELEESEVEGAGPAEQENTEVPSEARQENPE
jgi:hypothetical protein